MNDLNLRDTIAPKSDQLNADDLIGPDRVVTVTAVKHGPSVDQPVAVHFEGDGGRPYLPCKGMRRVLVHCWGDSGHDWVGKSMQLYRDPEVKFGGVKVGGIRIRALSHIDSAQQLSLTVTRSQRQPYRVEVLKPTQRPAYPADLFAEKLPVILETIEAGKLTPEQAISRLEQTGTLTDEQRAAVHQEVAAQ